MTWAKLSDDFADDCWTLSDAAFRLHVEGLCWNGRKLVDLRICKDDLRRFAKHPEAVAELLAVRWWTEDGDSYVIRHHAQYQRPREAVLAQQAANGANGKRGGRPRKIPSGAAETESVSESRSGVRTERDRTGPVSRTGDEQADDPDGEPNPWLPSALPRCCAPCGGLLGREREAAGWEMCGSCDVHAYEPAETCSW